MDICHVGFISLLHSIEKDGIQPETWVFLSTLFGDEMVKSVKELFSKETITLIIAKKSRRNFWVITSNKGIRCLWMDEKSFYCSCPAFLFRTMNNGKSPFCKHILAAYICNSLYKKDPHNVFFKIMEYQDEIFAEVMEKALTECESSK